jgi:hypothetical protein
MQQAQVAKAHSHPQPKMKGQTALAFCHSYYC